MPAHFAQSDIVVSDDALTIGDATYDVADIADVRLEGIGTADSVWATIGYLPSDRMFPGGDKGRRRHLPK